MKEIQGSSLNWKKYTGFTLIVGGAVALLSVASDNLPYLGDGVTIREFLASYPPLMVNSLPMWFIFAMIAGYLFGQNIKQAALLGTIYTLVAITFYFLISDFFTDVRGKTSFKEIAAVRMKWYGASFFGGMVGGGVGFWAKKTPFALLVLVPGLILQLFLNGGGSWNDIVGIAQNVTYVLMVAVIIVYVTLAGKKVKVRDL